MKEANEFERLRDALRNFAQERDWDKFHKYPVDKVHGSNKKYTGL